MHQTLLETRMLNTKGNKCHIQQAINYCYIFLGFSKMCRGWIIAKKSSKTSNNLYANMLHWMLGLVCIDFFQTNKTC